MANHHQLIVLGGGPGGYAAAFHAADRGLNVLLVDPEENPGGTCLYRGCIPSKAVLHAAKVVTDAREATEFGIEYQEPVVNVDKLRQWKTDVVKRLTGGLGMMAKQRKVTHLHGIGHLNSNRELIVELNSGGKEAHTFDHLILAPGLAIFLTVLALNLLGEGFLSKSKDSNNDMGDLL